MDAPQAPTRAPVFDHDAAQQAAWAALWRLLLRPRPAPEQSVPAVEQQDACL